MVVTVISLRRESLTAITFVEVSVVRRGGHVARVLCCVISFVSRCVFGSGVLGEIAMIRSHVLIRSWYERGRLLRYAFRCVGGLCRLGRRVYVCVSC